MKKTVKPTVMEVGIIFLTSIRRPPPAIIETGHALQVSIIKNESYEKDNVVIAYVPQRAGLRIPAFAYEFTWTYPGGQSQIVQRWREQRRRSDVIEVSRRYEYRMIAVDSSNDSIAGYLITDVLSPNV